MSDNRIKINEILESYFGIMTLKEDNFVTEMGNFLADVTDLPANIVLWTKPQPNELPHDKYRMKVFKDRIHVATYSISKNSDLFWKTRRKKYQLDIHEEKTVTKVISDFSSLFIQLIDEKITDNQAKYEIKRIIGQRD
jgi:hypothetical protein